MQEQNQTNQNLNSFFDNVDKGYVDPKMLQNSDGTLQLQEKMEAQANEFNQAMDEFLTSTLNQYTELMTNMQILLKSQERINQHQKEISQRIDLLEKFLAFLMSENPKTKDFIEKIQNESQESTNGQKA